MSKRKEQKEFGADLRELAKLCDPMEAIIDTTTMSGEIFILSGLDCNTKEIKPSAMYKVTYYHYRFINPHRQLKKLVGKCNSYEQKQVAVAQYITEHRLESA